MNRICALADAKRFGAIGGGQHVEILSRELGLQQLDVRRNLRRHLRQKPEERVEIEVPLIEQQVKARRRAHGAVEPHLEHAQRQPQPRHLDPLRLDLTLPTLAENLALDEALLLRAESGGPDVLRFWTWPTFAVILGAGGKVAEEAELEACDRDSVPIARRSSGGGTVLLGPGCLLYSLVLAYDSDPVLADLHGSYRFILARMVAALSKQTPGIVSAGISDLAQGDYKFSGNAQQRKRTHLLHHGTLLHAFDLASIAVYLRHPPRLPDYRRDRSHGDFVRNLPVDAARIKEAIASAWSATEVETNWPAETTARLAVEKYGQDSWNRRR